MFYHNINPVILNIGPLEVRYYGLMYVISFIITYFILVYLSKQRKLKLTKDDIMDYLTYGIIGIILGARIFYILFYTIRTWCPDRPKFRWLGLHRRLHSHIDRSIDKLPLD